MGLTLPPLITTVPDTSQLSRLVLEFGSTFYHVSLQYVQLLFPYIYIYMFPFIFPHSTNLQCPTATGSYDELPFSVILLRLGANKAKS